jgi:hypothetical protein
MAVAGWRFPVVQGDVQAMLLDGERRAQTRPFTNATTRSVRVRRIYQSTLAGG